MLAEAAAELECISGPDALSREVCAVRLALLHEQKNWPAVRDLASELVRRGPEDAGVWVTWAYATRRADTLAAAELILLEAERHHPTEATIKFNLACYACQRGDMALARRRLDEAIVLDPKFSPLAATDPDLAPLRMHEATTDCQPGG